MAIVLVSVVLAVAVVLLITEKLPLDMTALGIVVVLMLLGLLAPGEAVAGFAHPAPLTIGALFVVSRGLMRTGALDVITTRLIRVVRGRSRFVLGLSLLLTAVFSAFLNNTPVVVLFISIVMAICCEFTLSPSKFLIPISFMSILAGTTTLIGTSTNIIVSDLAVQAGQAPIGMFELAGLGVPIALVGGAYLFLFSDRLLRAHKEPICELTHSERQRYISELQVPRTSTLVGKTPTDGFCEQFPDLELYQVLRGADVLEAADADVRIEPRDVLLVKGTARQLVSILDQEIAVLPKGEDGTIARPYDLRSLIVELVVPPGSTLVGRRLDRVVGDLDPRLHLLGVKRRRVHYSPLKLAGVRLAVGDILLVQSPAELMDRLRADGEFIVIDDVVATIIDRRKAPIALGIFAAMVVAASTGTLDILAAALAAAFAMLVTGCLRPRDAYRSLDVRVLLLIVGTLALGAALHKTGAADLYAFALLELVSGASPWVVLSALIALTSILSLFLSNNSTAVLLMPIALSVAAALQVDPRPFVVGLCFGASACYATPMGYQTNLLVHGPGGYSFMDYVRVGVPLNLLVWAASSICVPLIWPF
jgi:di/tricarboxylate transporter